MRFLALIHFALLAAASTVAQSWSPGHYSLPGGVTGRSLLKIYYSDFELGNYSGTGPYSTSIEVRNSSGRHVTTIRTNPRGRFMAQLPAGNYTLSQRVIPGIYPVSKRVTVRPGKFVPLTLTSHTDGDSGVTSVSGGISPPFEPPPPPFTGPPFMPVPTNGLPIVTTPREPFITPGTAIRP